MKPQEEFIGSWSELSIIPSEQTPKVPEIDDTFYFYGRYNKFFNEFLQFATMHTRAVGLAANQCALKGERVMARMFAIRDLKTRRFEIVVDPKIIAAGGMLRNKIEGCLTWSNMNIYAKRHHWVTVTYRDAVGELHEKTVKGFEAQIWQHEINHLNGVEEQVVDPKFFGVPKENIGRNDICPCGSGKKFKKCCIED